MKKRLDELLLSKSFFSDIKEARAEIMSGRIFVDGIRCDKAGTQIKEGAIISVKEKMPYVSRGGYKLAGAIDGFGICVTDLTCLDIGSSTGGFTDCLLQNGATKVYAVDVGVELSWKLRCDERVKVMEKTNIRYCTRDSFGTEFDFICGDVSFISLKHVFPVAESVLKENGICVFLVKPQFEAKREQVGEGGIVKDYGVHLEVLQRVIGYTQLICTGVLPSPIKGGEGNIEYLIRLEKKGTALSCADYEQAVKNARQRYEKKG